MFLSKYLVLHSISRKKTGAIISMSQPEQCWDTLQLCKTSSEACVCAFLYPERVWSSPTPWRCVRRGRTRRGFQDVSAAGADRSGGDAGGGRWSSAEGEEKKKKKASQTSIPLLSRIINLQRVNAAQRRLHTWLKMFQSWGRSTFSISINLLRRNTHTEEDSNSHNRQTKKQHDGAAPVYLM